MMLPKRRRPTEAMPASGTDAAAQHQQNDQQQQQQQQHRSLQSNEPTSTPTSTTTPTTSPTRKPTRYAMTDSDYDEIGVTLDDDWTDYPTESPVEPTDSPVEEEETDRDYSSSDLVPTGSPVEPTPAPVEPTASPVEPTEAPAVPTEAPAVPTASPVVPPTEQVEPTEAPVDPSPTVASDFFEPAAPAPAPTPAPMTTGSSTPSPITTGSYCGTSWQNAHDRCNDPTAYPSVMSIKACTTKDDCDTWLTDGDCWASIDCERAPRGDVFDNTSGATGGVVGGDSNEEPTDAPADAPAEAPAVSEPTTVSANATDPTAAPVEEAAQPTPSPVGSPVDNATVVSNNATIEQVPASSTNGTASWANTTTDAADPTDPTNTTDLSYTFTDDAAPTAPTATPTISSVPTRSPTVPPLTSIPGQLYSCAGAVPDVVDPQTKERRVGYDEFSVEFDWEVYVCDANCRAGRQSSSSGGNGDNDGAGTELSGSARTELSGDAPAAEEVDGVNVTDLPDPTSDSSSSGSDSDSNATTVLEYLLGGSTANSTGGDDGSGRMLQSNSTASELDAALSTISGSYLADLAEEYQLGPGGDCSGFVGPTSSSTSEANSGNGTSRMMVRRRLLVTHEESRTRRRQLLQTDDTMVVELNAGDDDVLDDSGVSCVTPVPNGATGATCYPVKGSVGVKTAYGTDEESVRNAVKLSVKDYLTNLPDDGTYVAGAGFVGTRTSGSGKGNLDPASPAAAEIGIQNDDSGKKSYSDLGIAFMFFLALALLIVGVLMFMFVRRRRRSGRDAHGAKAAGKNGEDGSFAAAMSTAATSQKIGILSPVSERDADGSNIEVLHNDASPNDLSKDIAVDGDNDDTSPGCVDTTDEIVEEQSGEWDDVEMTLDPSDLADPNFEGVDGNGGSRKPRLGFFGSRSRSSRGRSKSPASIRNLRKNRSLVDSSSVASPDPSEQPDAQPDAAAVDAASILNDLQVAPHEGGGESRSSPPVDAEGTDGGPSPSRKQGQDIEAVLDYYIYDDAMVAAVPPESSPEDGSS